MNASVMGLNRVPLRMDRRTRGICATGGGRGVGEKERKSARDYWWCGKEEMLTMGWNNWSTRFEESSWVTGMVGK